MLFMRHSPVRILSMVARRVIQNPSSRHVSVNTRYHHTLCYTCSGWTRRRGGPFSGQAPPSINPTVSPLTQKLLSYQQKFSTSGQENKDKYLIESNLVLRKYLEGLVEEYDGLNRTLLDLSGEGGDSEGIGKRMVELEPLVQRMVQFQRKQAQLGEIGQMVTELGHDDPEVIKMADEEREQCDEELQQLQGEIVSILLPDEQIDNNDIILEVTAGVGGQEAMLFTSDMFDMYHNYASFCGWNMQVIDYEKSESGGVRRASASISGEGVFRCLKYEGGVHRVQRVPKTEKSGRVHTSTMAVAVLPQVTEIDVQLHAKDLRIDTFRASGSGGQHVNTTDSAVRITHIPTGTVAESQQERSQIKNREICMKMLRSRIYQKQMERQVSAQKTNRKLQMGSAGRSEKIRTYNFNQDRITDHRIGKNMFNVESFFEGGEGLDEMIELLQEEAQKEILEEFLETIQQEDVNRK